MFNLQIIVNIIFSFSLYLIVSLSFSVIYQAIKFFHLAHAVIITFAAYIMYYLAVQFNINLWMSIICSIIFATLIGISCEILIYKPLRKIKISSFLSLIVSLGVYIILQNIISLLWGDSSKTLRSFVNIVSYNILGAYLTNVQIVTIIFSILMFILVILLLNKTKLGLKIRAVSSNKDNSSNFGINYNKIVNLTFIIGSMLAAVVGILLAFDTSFKPTTGFELILFGIIAMIIGGIGSYKGLLWASLTLSTAQHVSVYFIGSRWMNAMAYIVLILFLIWKPLGFSGKRLKKTEI